MTDILNEPSYSAKQRYILKTLKELCQPLVSIATTNTHATVTTLKDKSTLT